MFCGNCLRDNALVGALRRLGHQALMVPLYLPIRLDEADQSEGTPVFFGGVNVYLDQKLSLYRRAPAWLRRWLDSPGLLRRAAGRAARTRAAEVGDITISMLRGEEGHQRRQLGELAAWLKTQSPKPDVICLSNALLAGLARRLKAEVGAPVVCTLQGEDSFLDGLPDEHRERAWATLAAQCPAVSLFIAPSHYYGDRMRARLNLPGTRVRVVHNGISLEGYDETPAPGFKAGSAEAPVLGFFARMCREKGLDMLVEAFILLKRRGSVPNLKLRVGGSCGPGDQPFVQQVQQRLRENGCLAHAEFHPNVDRAAKIAFLKSLSVFSVPALYGEAFGLYLIEALAAGVPAVQPRHAAFPELIEATGGGLVCDPTPEALARTIEELLAAPERRQALGQAGRQAVQRDFTVERMAENMLRALGEVGGSR